MIRVLAMGLLSLILATPAAHAADAAHPYRGVDRKVDAGNDTGDAKTDSLNRGQLDQNYRGQSPAVTGMPGNGPGTAPSYQQGQPGDSD